MNQLAVVVLLALAGVVCGVLDGDEEDVLAVWDLRETRAVDAVGWPEDAGSSFEARSEEGLERILLPGGVVVEGEFRVNPFREGGLEGRPYDEHLRSLSVTFEREPVDAVLVRARGYAEQVGVELGDIPGWAAANAGGQALGIGGTSALSGRSNLGPGGPSAQLATRSFANGGGVLRLLVTWPREEEAT